MMNALAYDNFSVSSDGSGPRTPSPGSSLVLDDPAYAISSSSPSAFETVFDTHGIPSSSAFPPSDYMLSTAGFTHHASVDVAPPAWQNNVHGTPLLHPVQSAGRSMLLQELYEHELPPDHVPHGQGHHDAYYHHSAEPQYAAGGADWSTPPTSSHGLPGSPHGLPPMRSPHDNMIRRNTFPYVRQDQDSNGAPFPQHPAPHYVDHPHMLAPFGRPDMMYGEPMPMGPGSHMPLAAEPSALHAPRMEEGYGGHMPHHDPHGYRHGMDDGSVKIEENGPVMIPPQGGFYRPPSAGMPMGFLPHTGLPIQHTDDAASKETQYLRRRCFNCHTTEPPSWRRSTLNPGKIVCNKCGLYERTHLRPRPLRFDELRAGNKARKAATKTAPSPKQQRAIKKDSEALSRRASISSTNSSIGGSSDWDDGASVYSTGSSSYASSPSQSTFSIPRDSASASPPMLNAESSIRLPSGGLNDIALRDAAHMPHKSASTPVSYYPYAPVDAQRRNTINVPLGSPGMHAEALRRPLSSQGAPQEWANVAADDVTPTATHAASPKSLAVS